MADHAHPATEPPRDFIRQIVADDLTQGRVQPPVVTRFPPEPNGYLHIGHAKAIALDFGIADEFDGLCRLRFDDTNPSKEDVEYVDAIIRDVQWLTGREHIEVRYASDYFPQMYAWAEALISKGLAYVDDQDGETIRRNRGTVTSPGVNSPWRDRSPEENLELFRSMRDGQCAPGSRVLRAKIDMAHANMLLRDPLMYRIQFDRHHRTGDTWKIYPLYDWAHGLEDAIEGVTHSLCTLEFATHRPLYDWYLEQLELDPRPHQYEFNRLNLSHTVMSKRKLMELVQRGLVKGWDDPRMPTLCGLRRRGVPPAAITTFCREVGYTKVDTTNEWALLEYHIRQELNRVAPRAMAVLRPLLVEITHWDDDRKESAHVPINPEDPDAGTRQLPAGRLLYIDQDDFMEDPPKKFFRLRPGGEVRLRGLGYLRCDEIVRDANGGIERLRCSIDEATLHGGAPTDGRKVKATIHWVDAASARNAEVRLYTHLFTAENPLAVDEGEDWTTNIDVDSCTVITDAKIPAFLTEWPVGAHVQFERLGYFCPDHDHRADRPVFNRTATLRDAWAKAKGAS
ncbi:MAG: glutamine--tRNA ligase/YqeY domain fusion protein [Planctomycetota bacterium]|nr:MAG: glutamine--tRNA ligase/YqeY domain fusion protein [Planctomycetota bacterium]